MSTNLQSTKQPPMRSASLGSSFFAKDTSSFFVKDDSLADDATTLDDSSLTPAPTDLDLVGALATLDLDGDLESTLPDAPARDTPALGTPFAQQTPFFASVPHAGPLAATGRGHGSYGSLTPNPPALAPFGAGAAPASLANGTSTPSSTWGTGFVPFSAPPFAYAPPDAGAVSELAMRIAPFELPDGQPDKKPVGVSGAVPPGMHAFGGVLDQRFAFGGVSEPFALPDYDDSDKKRLDGEPHAPKPNVWNAPAQYYRSDRNGSNGSSNSGNGNGSSTGGNGTGSGSSSSGNGFGQSNYPAYNYNYNYSRRRNTHMDSGVNVHRKMHGAGRRKGDDAAKYANAKLEDFTGDLYALCKDQHGCRFLQRQLDATTDPAVATAIYTEIHPRIVELMTDPFGNYLMQKLFEHVSPDQRYMLVRTAAPDLVRIALDPHGTRALQKLVECVSTPAESQLIIDSLAPHVVTLARDLNGNHVVQKCSQRLSAADNQFIFDLAAAHCYEIATHRHGCCVLQRCLDHGTAEQRHQLSVKVAENATSLALDPFGNYVVQYVLSCGDEAATAVIVQHIRENAVQMCLHKFGSNVVEKLLRLTHLTDTIVAVLLAHADKFGMMLNDPFGNYVLQTSLDVAKPSDLTKLALCLHPLLPSIKNTPHGRRIMTKIQNIA